MPNFLCTVDPSVKIVVAVLTQVFPPAHGRLSLLGPNGEDTWELQRNGRVPATRRWSYESFVVLKRSM